MTEAVNLKAQSDNHLSRSHMTEFPCAADIGTSDTERERSIHRDVSGNQFQKIADSGSGFECYGPDHKRFGRPEVLKAITSVAEEWAKRYPSGPRLGVGNLSLEQGGEMPPHTSHQDGVDVDFAPIASTNAEIGLTWTAPEYSRDRTQELVNLLKANPHAQVKLILFNDPDVQDVEPWAGHDNHLHVRFIASDVSVIASDQSSDAQGSLRLVAPNMKGDRVQKLQDDLVKVGISLEKADGIFGGKTDAAVREFQVRFGLAADGVAGTNTLNLLKEIRAQQNTAQTTAGTANQLKPLFLKEISDQGLSIDFSDVKTSEFALHPELCREVQVKLQSVGLLTDAGTAKAADGKFGAQTQAAIRQFKANNQLGGSDVLDAATANVMLESQSGSASLPKWLGGDRNATVVAIRQEANRQGITNKDQIAYIIATTQHETAGSFEPVRESYFLGEPDAEDHRKTLFYYPYYGRGYVQLTHDFNYRTYSTLTELDLINDPDLVMRPDVALFVLVHGMKNGTFTGLSLDDVTSGSSVDFVRARQIINGTDRDVDIAAIADEWASTLA
ncbi:MAG: penicillin-insensitive murein endopeptidase [Pseudanabaena sp. ELA748]